jgi:hypothetical protein
MSVGRVQDQTIVAFAAPRLMLCPAKLQELVVLSSTCERGDPRVRHRFGCLHRSLYE